jgi:hypothetical protein
MYPSACHAASTASPEVLPRPRRGRGRRGSGRRDFWAIHASRASRETRGERPTAPAVGSSPARIARRIVSTPARACAAASAAVSGAATAGRTSSAANRASTSASTYATSAETSWSRVAPGS